MTPSFGVKFDGVLDRGWVYLKSIASIGPIDMIDMKGTDLNLLLSFDVLIEEANVTRAAARLGISQPALSAQLARLRGIFGDPLLVPSVLPTTRALELKDPLHAALKDLE